MLRYTGFMKAYNSVMRRYPRIHTVQLPVKYGSWKPDQALGPIRDVATANHDLKIVFSESDVMQAGIEQALKAAGMWNRIIEGAYDGGMNTIKEMVQDPNGPVQADASNQPWDQGTEAVKMAVAAYNHQKSACPTGIEYIKTTVVTPQNAKKYYNPHLTYVRAHP
jgi:ribose transport system substrate-binding protein